VLRTVPPWQGGKKSDEVIIGAVICGFYLSTSSHFHHGRDFARRSSGVFSSMMILADFVPSVYGLLLLFRK
jgi:hypothetical protein